jgi:hypothetical protein
MATCCHASDSSGRKWSESDSTQHTSILEWLILANDCVMIV